MSTAPDRNPEDEPAYSPDREITRPEIQFDKTTLWPYSRGSRLLLAQVYGEQDTVSYRALAFVFIHLKRTEKTAEADMARHVVGLAWDIDRFRAHIAMVFRDTLTPEQEGQAVEIYIAELDREEKSRVSVGPKPGTAKRGPILKKKATTPAKRCGKPSRSPKPSASRGKK